jgi:hypothetical protein
LSSTEDDEEFEKIWKGSGFLEKCVNIVQDIVKYKNFSQLKLLLNSVVWFLNKSDDAKMLFLNNKVGCLTLCSCCLKALETSNSSLLELLKISSLKLPLEKPEIIDAQFQIVCCCGLTLSGSFDRALVIFKDWNGLKVFVETIRTHVKVMNHAKKSGGGSGIVFIDKDPDFICLFSIVNYLNNFCNNCFNKRTPGSRIFMADEFDSADTTSVLLDLFSLLYNDMKALLDNDGLDGTNACAGNILNLVILELGCMFCGKTIDKTKYEEVVEYSTVLKGMEKKKWWDWNYSTNCRIYWKCVL